MKKSEDPTSLRARLGKALLKSNPGLKARLAAERNRKRRSGASALSTSSNRSLDDPASTDSVIEETTPRAARRSRGAPLAAVRNPAPAVSVRQHRLANTITLTDQQNTTISASSSQRTSTAGTQTRLRSNLPSTSYEPVVAPRLERVPEPIPIQPEIIHQRQRDSEEMEERKRKAIELLKKSHK